MVSVDADLGEQLSKVNASELVNNLLRQHFFIDTCENIAVFRSEMAKNSEKKAILLKKNRFFKERIADIQAKKEAKEHAGVETEVREKRRKEVEEHKRKWKNDEITDDEYWEFFDE